MISKEFKPDRKENYLIDRQRYNDSQDNCMICMDVITHPERCRRCLTRFCRKCVSRWRLNSNTCPLKCSKEWEVEEAPTTGIALSCPYSRECNKILTPQTFESHAEECNRADNNVKEAIRRKQECLCLNDHRLSFFIDRFVNHEELHCQSCQQHATFRVRCEKCKTYYCSDCRNPPLTKYICPYEHVLVFKNSSPGCVCDCCGLQPFYRNMKCYDDMSCRVAICQECYQKLPLPPRRLIQWVKLTEQEEKLSTEGTPQKSLDYSKKEYQPLDNQEEWEQYDPALWL